MWFKKLEPKVEAPEIIRYRQDLREKDEYWAIRNSTVETRSHLPPFYVTMDEWKNDIEQLERKRIREGKRITIYPEDD